MSTAALFGSDNASSPIDSAMKAYASRSTASTKASASSLSYCSSSFCLVRIRGRLLLLWLETGGVYFWLLAVILVGEGCIRRVQFPSFAGALIARVMCRSCPSPSGGNERLNCTLGNVNSRMLDDQGACDPVEVSGVVDRGLYHDSFASIEARKIQQDVRPVTWG